MEVKQCLSTIQRIAERNALAKENRDLQETVLAALRESEAELRNLMESTPDGLSVTVGGKIVYGNQAIAELSGYKKEEFVGTSPFDHFHPRDHERAAARLREIARGGASDLAEYTMIRKDGTEVPVEIFSGRINFGGEPGIVSTVREITVRKQADEALRGSRAQLQALSGYLLRVREDERTRIANEVHDELTPMMTALKMDLSWLHDELEREGDKQAGKTASMLTLVDKTIAFGRRLIERLRPSVLDGLGLVAAAPPYR